jgi:uncharacterized membrane protein YccC
MSDAMLGFLGGILATLVAALLTNIFRRHNEARRRHEEAHLAIYFMLMELSQHYFWVASAELHQQEAAPEVLGRCRQVAWKLADRLRTFDDVANLEEILTILFSTEIPSANERANRLNAVIESYGKTVNPAYARHIGRISAQNVMRLGAGGASKNNAPGLWSL